ncbi:chromosomal replication initiator protein DnaA [Phocaeicola paurosaccharolyticus]|jgi:chromosomal replication initiator protein|uniref:chromosomal replication initiator protein DnaA n=1 Tax=Phocaeicola paurosaccharolyticus TaxID=732242 RepID=UPI002FE03030
MIVNDPVVLWKHCLDIIKDNVAETTYKTWFEPIVPMRYEDKALTIGVPSPFFYEFLEEKFVDLLRSVLYKVIGEGTQLMYSVLTDKTNHISVNMEGTNRSPAISKPTSIHEANKSPNMTQAPVIQELDPHLNPNYNFENFIKGSSNEFSRTVGETVAKDPAKTFNPLFLYGPSGVGKTHLTNAIGTRIKELYPNKRVLYVSAHLFQVQYTDSVRTNHFNDFISFYQSIDVLIIDDIQEFAGVTKTQNTFFHIFNHLHQNGKQLILTSDRAPVMLQGMEDRLLTRFKWGLVAELDKPDVELRKNILRNKIKRDGLTIPESVINYIAENVNESVRELEGIINSLLAQSILFKRDIDLDLTQRIVKKAVKCCESKPLSIEDIISKVCAHYEIDESAIHTKTRKREIVQVRQVAMYLAKKHTESSSSKIGQLIGNKDHATVLHACKIVKDQVDVDKSFKSEIEEIESSLRSK